MSAISLPSLLKDLSNEINKIKLSNYAKLEKRFRLHLKKALEEGKNIYGVNTGFGALCKEKIEAKDLSTLQHNILQSHAVGVGELVPKVITQIMLGLKIYSLSLGDSGISTQCLERLLWMWRQKWIPTVPCKGSVGASGDLLPLAHLSLPLIGEGFFWDQSENKSIPALSILKKHHLAPLKLAPKDGLSLVNGTQCMTAYGAYTLGRCHDLIRLADLICALSFEAWGGQMEAFDPRIANRRPHKGAKQVAFNLRRFLKGSKLCDRKIQDPYSLRCTPQVHGSCRDALKFAIKTVETEIHSSTDNPLFFENGQILSGGNFHGQPLAHSFDFAALALASLSSISERRIFLLQNAPDKLPKFLISKKGVNSGFMLTQYVAASLVSENKILSHPASCDSIPTSQGQEDHVSMGSIASRKLLEVYKNTQQVLSIELLNACQALDFRIQDEKKPLGQGTSIAHSFVRSFVSHRIDDGPLKKDLALCTSLIQSGQLLKQLESALGNLL